MTNQDEQIASTAADGAPAAAPGRGRRGAKADATRRQLLDAALEVIGEKGYSAATVDEIVEAAGVSKGVAYYHFKSKAAMAESILESGIGRIVAGFECIAAEAPSAAEALTGMIELFASGIFENRDFGRFFVSELWREGRVWSESMRGFEARLLDVLEGQLRRGQDEGVIRPEIDPAFEAVALVGLVLTTTLYYIGDDGPLARAAGRASSAGAGPSGPGAEDADKDAFIEQICDFVRHANARPGLLH